MSFFKKLISKKEAIFSLKLFREKITPSNQEVFNMSVGQVICVYRVLPNSPEDFEKVKKVVEAIKPRETTALERVDSAVNVVRMEEEPIAFGLKALLLTVLIPEIEGKVDEFEKKISSIKGVKSIECVKVSRSL